jgi:hypothetical protein
MGPKLSGVASKVNDAELEQLLFDYNLLFVKINHFYIIGIRKISRLIIN